MIIALIALHSVLCAAQPSPAPGPLFLDASPPRAARLPGAGSALRSRFVTVDLRQLGAAPGTPPRDRLALNLFDGITLGAFRESPGSAVRRGTVWTGAIDGDPDGQALIAVVDGAVSADVRTGDAVYGVRYAGDGVHLLYEADPSAGLPDVEVVPPAGGIPRWFAPPRAAASGEAIDLLVVYTQDARLMNGGTAGIESLITLAVQATNEAYANSNVAQRLNLVHMAEVAYAETSDADRDLDNLRNGFYGLDVVHALRETYGADLVSLIVYSNIFGGAGYLMTPELLGPAFAEYAYSVVKASSAVDNFAFAHELGHNMGCEHDRPNAAFHGAYPYSYGYQEPGGVFRTIMAYRSGCPGSCPVIGYFSNPDVYYGGAPTGVNYLASNSADNARTLNNTAPIVANFRGGSGPVPGDYLTVTVSSASPVAGDPFTVDAAVQPLGTRFDAYGVVIGQGGPWSFDLANPGALRPGVTPLATNVPGLGSLWSGRIFTLGAIPPEQSGRAYTVVVGLVPAGRTPSIQSAVPGYLDQEQVAVR